MYTTAVHPGFYFTVSILFFWIPVDLFVYLGFYVETIVLQDTICIASPGADFTKGLKSRFRLKFKSLVLNFVNRMLSLWS